MTSISVIQTGLIGTLGLSLSWHKWSILIYDLSCCFCGSYGYESSNGTSHARGHSSWQGTCRRNSRRRLKNYRQSIQRRAITGPDIQENVEIQLSCWGLRIPCYETYEIQDKVFKEAVLARLLLPLEELHPAAFPDNTRQSCGMQNLANFSDHACRCPRFTLYRQSRHKGVRIKLRDVCVHAR
jgi:hypothetical protein